MLPDPSNLRVFSFGQFTCLYGQTVLSLITFLWPLLSLGMRAGCVLTDVCVAR